MVMKPASDYPQAAHVSLADRAAFCLCSGESGVGDWTKGCIAVTDDEIEEIDALAPNGTLVEIRP